MAASSTEVVGTIYTHRVDAQDRITDVSDNWDAFAASNGAPDTCLSHNVLGTKLWDHIRDGETGHLYETLLAKSRETGKSITVPIRCDAPEFKRHIEMPVDPASCLKNLQNSRMLALAEAPSPDPVQPYSHTMGHSPNLPRHVAAG